MRALERTVREYRAHNTLIGWFPVIGHLLLVRHGGLCEHALRIFQHGTPKSDL